MTQYNSLNVKLSNSQLDKLKSASKSKVVLRLSLLTNRQVADLRKAFANSLPVNIKLSYLK